MASPVADIGQSHHHHHQQQQHQHPPPPHHQQQPGTVSAADSAFQEAQKWIEAVTGRCFGDKDFRGGLENGILLCELLSSIKPGLVKKINRLPTPIAGLDNLSVFLRGCEELGLKGSQLFDPGDLQDTPTRPTAKGSDCSRKLKNVLITIYWLGRAANGCTSYNGPTLDLKEFEGLLAQMRKEAEEAESPKRSIRDSGYIDCWDSERSDSLSPPHHGREDSFDSLDSFGSRSRQTPSPDVPVARCSSDGRGSDSESDGPNLRKMPDLRKDDMLARRTSVSEPRTAMPFNQYLPNKSNQSGYVPTPLRKKKSDKEDGGRKSWSTATSPIGGDRPLRSVSMIDMRGEEETITQPHNQVRHALMHNQYTKMKEEEDHWQDDLAKWKNRRRSVSQDLIKKEEERKMMEQLLTGDTCISQRRRSIKTYREIVQDKERREEELRDAYRRARTPEEASAILHRYAQRFSISDAVLERLQLPKLLDRSISADPSFPGSPFPLSLSASPTTPDPFDEDPNGPLRFLRQQSAPAPKFTSTLEARIEEFPKDSSSHQRPQIRSRSSEPPSTHSALSPKPVPLLTPKPYFESGARAAESRANKADGFLRVNGNGGDNGVPTSPERRGRESPPRFEASPSYTNTITVDTSSSSSAAAAAAAAASPAHHCPLVSPTGGSPVLAKAKEAQGGTEEVSEDLQEQRGTEHSSPLSRPTSLPAELQKPQESFWKAENQAAAAAAAPQENNSDAAAHPAPHTEAKQEEGKVEPSAQNNCSLVQSGVDAPQNPPVTSQASFLTSQESQKRESELSSAASQPSQEITAELANTVRSPLATSNPKLRCEFFAPPGEAEKERRGSEKYRREQEKLKEEWEKAQREVAEEERKYHEEERRILEETVAPLTPRSSALPSPSRGELSSTAEPHDTIVRSLADWERKQELLERQSRASVESAEGRRRENDRTSDISTADDSMKTGRSLVSQSSSQQETLAHSLQNGQKAPHMKPSTPVKKHPELTADGNKAGRPAGERRAGPVDNNMSRSSSKPPAACPPTADSLPPSPNRSVSGKKLCSSCGQPLGKGAAMIIETLSLYFHIQCFKCGVCKGQLGDTTTGTDVRIRNGLLNCQQCYIRSRSAGQPTTL
ncbi:LIM and calponin-likey domains-containing 1 isoform X9 [Solea senegalensis]|uniref:LIM and calponin-likey domains-containing 1 isoform X9 n=1 Tax=Solea senegalensis TaxID=28829 RepID=A0AAV6SJS3_SOLSE|nr:LIM and calponin homology domains-containing protein 1-like isoform X8 [Solea senegalensis]KAG7517168.1 LIM and calponin-likey domains-containing 1 isoform X9 [Solea senegalensis]